jgi:hypothetical protein
LVTSGERVVRVPPKLMAKAAAANGPRKFIEGDARSTWRKAEVGIDDISQAGAVHELQCPFLRDDADRRS